MSGDVPSPVRDIAESVRAQGGRALVVGGWVRDRLMGHTSKDVDLEVFGVPPTALRALLERFGRVNAVGESFTVYKLGDVDANHAAYANGRVVASREVRTAAKT